MQSLFMFMLLLCGPFLIFNLSIVVNARILSEETPLSPPARAPNPSLFTSMASLTPGVEVRSENHHMKSNKTLLIALIVASASLGAIILFLILFWLYRRRIAQRSHEDNYQNSDGVNGIPLSPFMNKYNSFKTSCKKVSVAIMEYDKLEEATNNFHESKILGQGGFGCVYEAQLEDNFFAAVKRLDGGTQDSVREFETEIELLSKIQHTNIISLLGYSIHGETRLLVYELMENGSLETQLHGASKGSALTWYTRMKIALDAARGLEYLHEHCNPSVIHRDLKSSNILLDSNFNAKLSDFGLAIVDGAQNKSNLKLSGTLGYVAPEYLLDGKLTDKSDVYAFGVVLLELLLGRRPVEKLSPSKCESIVTWAMPQLTDRALLPNIVDPVIKDTIDLKHLYQVAAVAVLCVQPEPSYRPLITDVLYSLIPLVPVELGGTLRVVEKSRSGHYNV